MRKYYLSIAFLISGILLLGYGYYAKVHVVYPDSEFGTKSDAYSSSIREFFNRSEDLSNDISLKLKSLIKTRDTLKVRDYFLKHLEGNEALKLVGLLGDDYKVLAINEGNSVLYALDSTGKADVVLWKRFKKNELVSLWYESLEESLEDNQWFRKCKESEDVPIWFLAEGSRNGGGENSSAFKLLFCGYPLLFENQKIVLLVGYSQEPIKNMLQESGLGSGNSRISIFTSDNRDIQLLDPPMEEHEELNKAIMDHLRRFEEVPKGTFSFKHQGEYYWNYFDVLPESSGVNKHLLTISNTDLNDLASAGHLPMINWGGIFLLATGVLLLGIRKRFFYRPNRMEIPDLDSILQDDENRYLEFKSSLRWDYRQEKVNPELEKVILKTLAAFGNTDGGILLLGVDDDKNVIGLEKDFLSLKKQNADYYEVHLRNILHREMGVKYVSKNLRMDFEKDDNGKTVCKIKVLPADEPMFLKFKNKNGLTEEKFFVRSGNSSHEIPSISEINDYINKKFRK